MPKFEKKKEAIEAFRTKGNRLVDTAEGPRQAKPGQWIVEDGDGVYLIMDDALFREKYSPKDDEAKKALSAELKTAEQQADEAQEKAAAEQQAETEKVADEEAKEKWKLPIPFTS